VFNIGFGELLLIAVLGLLVFGPDRLPEAVRKGTAMLQQLRTMALDARRQVSDAAGLDETGTSETLNDLRDLHPRRIASSVLAPADPAEADTGASPQRSAGIDPDLT